MLVPFCRLDLTEEPIAEAERCLDAGRCGIKLHPRAQYFDFGERRPEPGVQARRRAAGADPDPRRPRPAGDRRRSAPPRRAPSRRAADPRPRRHRRPRADRRARWSTIRTSSTTRRSGSPPTCARCSRRPRPSRSRSRATRRTACWRRPGSRSALVLRRAGATEDQMRAISGATPSAPCRGEPAPRSRPPLMARERTMPLQRLRIHEYLVMAQTLMWSRLGDMPGALGLARRACDTDGSDELGDVVEAAGGGAELWTEGLSIEDETPGRTYTRSAMRRCRSRTRSSRTCDRRGRPGRRRGPALRRAEAAAPDRRPADARAGARTRGRNRARRPGRRAGGAGGHDPRARRPARRAAGRQRPLGREARPRRFMPGWRRCPTRRSGRSSCSATGRASTRAPSTAWLAAPAGRTPSWQPTTARAARTRC